MKANKVTSVAVAALAAAALTACGNKADKAEADTTALDPAQVEMAEIEETVPADSAEVELPPVEETAEAAPAPEQKKEAKADAYTATASGLKYKVLKKGNGKKPSATDVVKVHYEGKLTNGQVFDSSYQRGTPAEFPLNRVIAGWTEGVQLMNEGSVYEFYIPYNLAYGERGVPGAIPPKSDLIFKVELIEVE